MSLSSRMTQPTKLWHTLAAVVGGAGAVSGTLWAFGGWMGMPSWGPAAASAQMTRRFDSVITVQARRDTMQDLVSMTIDARMDSMSGKLEAILRLECVKTTPDELSMSGVREACR